LSKSLLAKFAKIWKKQPRFTISLDICLEYWYNVYIGLLWTVCMSRDHGQTKANRAKTQAKYNSQPSQIKKRSQRNSARAKMIAAGKAKKGDGKDVAHRNNNTNQNGFSNLLVQSPSKNRSFKRNSKGGHK
jgi:hypothetical protein